MKKNKNPWSHLTPTEFEEFIMEILRRGGGDIQNIRRLGGPGDRARDIVFEKRFSILLGIGDSGPGIVCCYHPKSERLSRRKVKTDFDDAMQHNPDIVVFVTSAKLLSSDVDWFNGIKNQYIFHIYYIDRDDIASFLSKPENGDLLEKYFPGDPGDEVLKSTGGRKRSYLDLVNSIWASELSKKEKIKDTQQSLKKIFRTRNVPKELKLLYLKDSMSLIYKEKGKCIVKAKHDIINVSNSDVKNIIYRIGGIAPMSWEQINPQVEFQTDGKTLKNKVISPKFVSAGKGWVDLIIPFTSPLLPGNSTRFILTYRWDYPSTNPLGLRWNVFIVDSVCIETIYSVKFPKQYKVTVLGVFRKEDVWSYKEEKIPRISYVRGYPHVNLKIKLPRMDEEIHLMVKINK